MSREEALPIPAADALAKMAAPVSSHQHGGENAQQQGGEEGIAPFSPPDALARRDEQMRLEGMQLAANLCRSKSMSNAAIGAMSDATEAEELAEEIEAAIRARAVGKERQG